MIHHFGTSKQVQLDNEPVVVHAIAEYMESLHGQPPSYVTPGSPQSDFDGCDYWAHYELKYDTYESCGIDVKVRKKTFDDDLCIEIYSQVEADKVGWALDANKKNKYVLFYWQDTEKWVGLDRARLFGHTIGSFERWGEEYGVQEIKTEFQDGSTKTTQCAFVPTDEFRKFQFFREGSLIEF